MLSTGIRTDVGVKVYGQNLDSIAAVSAKVKSALEAVPGVKDLYVDPITGGKYLTIDIRRDAIARYGLSVDAVNTIVESRSDERRVGSECVSTCRSRWSRVL